LQSETYQDLTLGRIVVAVDTLAVVPLVELAGWAADMVSSAAGSHRDYIPTERVVDTLAAAPLVALAGWAADKLVVVYPQAQRPVQLVADTGGPGVLAALVPLVDLERLDP
jgi:hypothetical protein